MRQRLLVVALLAGWAAPGLADSRPASSAQPDPPAPPPLAQPDPPAPPPSAQPYPPPAPLPPPPIPRPFDRGTLDFGLAFGFSSGGGTSFGIGGHFGYFVLPGLEPGLQLDVTFGSDRPTVTGLMPYLRWVIWRSYAVSPFVKAQGGRLFVVDQRDATALGGGGGLVMFLSRQLGLQLEVLVFRLLPSDVCDPCTTTDVGLSLGFYL